jgi:hypothetical protein
MDRRCSAGFVNIAGYRPARQLLDMMQKDDRPRIHFWVQGENAGRKDVKGNMLFLESLCNLCKRFMQRGHL